MITRFTIIIALSLSLSCATQKRDSSISSKDGQKTPSNQKDLIVNNPSLPGLDFQSPNLIQKLHQALKAKTSSYKPRTQYQENGVPKFTNRLIFESSPYLLQHAHNPVNWHSWNDEAFKEAKISGKPIFLSIGYSTCHWCHVMEEESFDNIEVATLINKYFIPIKVDREERPDIDDIYMKAVNILTGRGGWPMTLLLTPEKKPFFAGTYFPPRQGVRGARMGLEEILTLFHEKYQDDPEILIQQANELSHKIALYSSPKAPGDLPSLQHFASIKLKLQNQFDPAFGGFGHAPKFPQPSRLNLLLQDNFYTQDQHALKMVQTTLDKMKEGGIHDQIGGGFHRYSTDKKWLIPHFEKMLYDNAQLAQSYLLAGTIINQKENFKMVRDILDYISKEMTSQEGGFYSATDADNLNASNNMEEGDFFIWTFDEINQIFNPKETSFIQEYFGMSAKGNFEGKNILFQSTDLNSLADKNKLSISDAKQLLKRAKKLLYQERLKRKPPLRDEKILVAWNGLMIKTFANAGFILNETKYIGQAEKGMNFILNKMRTHEGRLLRSYLEKKTSKHAAYLSDYAMTISALLDLFEATQDIKWLKNAIELQNLQDTYYQDKKNGGYFMTANDQEKLIAHNKPFYDGAIPSGNSVSADNLIRLRVYTDNSNYKKEVENLFKAFSSEIKKNYLGMPYMMQALAHYHMPSWGFALIYPDGKKENAKDLIDLLRHTYFPLRALVIQSDSETQKTSLLIPWLKGKKSLDNKVTLYICEEGRCELPVTTTLKAKETLKRSHQITSKQYQEKLKEM